MKNKTCGECKHFDSVGQCNYVHEFNNVHVTDKACSFFEQTEVITIGDKIRQGGNRALAEFHQKPMCSVCIYKNAAVCKAPNGKMANCTDGIEAWLNTPAESEEKK